MQFGKDNIFELLQNVYSKCTDYIFSVSKFFMIVLLILLILHKIYSTYLMIALFLYLKHFNWHHLLNSWTILLYIDTISITTEADRDLMDWTGKKPLDYRKQKTTVSASTYSSEYTDSSFVPPKNRHSSPFESTLFSTYPRRNRHSTVGVVHRNASVLVKSKAHHQPAADDGDAAETSSIAKSDDSSELSFVRGAKTNQSTLSKKLRSFNKRRAGNKKSLP